MDIETLIAEIRSAMRDYVPSTDKVARIREIIDKADNQLKHKEDA